ncbi:hypothetical protein V474_22665 [Novosphingobium barchaimii LL02]|uniref:DUF2239 domain-containing protein n=1 Tax=Novosphingobium barchaimii LL02 TaxID=1114963 RepID=A0A0J7XR55_9SPHN|nr:DUF2239 family protein [Novosphingobium barchaimii]KMS53518.1 hypothetical protein V474_22665 [Novosphingobium barchaimii LL02]
MTVTVFYKDDVIASGSPGDFAAALRDLGPLARSGDLLAFDDDTGRQVDLDLAEPVAPRPRGRPALGVEAREVTLLPRHWEWLSAQPGGASVTLRKLVEAAIRSGRSERECLDAACRFLTVMAGDRPGYEEATRALYAGDRDNFDALCVLWPSAVAQHARRLAWPKDAF